MISSLTQKPGAYTVQEWIFATLVPPLYAVAQETGLLAEIAKGNTNPDVLATRLGLSERSVTCIWRCLQAAGILIKSDDSYYQIKTDGLGIFSSHTRAVHALVDAANQGVFDLVGEDGILPSNAPSELSLLVLQKRLVLNKS